MKGIIDVIGSLIAELAKGTLGVFGEIINSFLDKDHSLKAEFGKARNVLHKKHTGIAIGNEAISLEQSLTGGLIIGKTGSGKTTKVYKQILYRTPRAKILESDFASFSYICLDPKGEIFRDCGASLVDKGYDIEIINFVDVSKSTHAWNPLAGLKDHEVNRFASEYIEATLKGSSSKSDPFWSISASRMLSFVIDLLRQFDTHVNLTNARYLLEILAGQPEKIDQLLSLEHIPDRLFDQYMALQNMGDKVLQSVLSTALASLQYFNDPNIVGTTSTSTLDMSSYRKKSKVLFVQNPPMAQEYVSGLNSLLFSAWFNSIMTELPEEGDKGDNTIVFLIDECPSLEGLKPSLIPTASSLLRQYNAYGVFGFQSFFQAERMLGKEGSKTLSQNVGSTLFLPGQDLETSKEISECLSRYSYTDQSGAEKTRPLLTHDQVTFLDGNPNGGILFSGQERGILLKNIVPFYKIPAFKKWSQKPIPELTYLQHSTTSLFPIDSILADVTDE